MRLLIISHEVVGSRMAGPGIRYWELARVLAEQHEVTLITPQDVLSSDWQPQTFMCGTYAWNDAASLDGWLRDAEVVVANGQVLQCAPDLGLVRPPLVLDLYDPTLLENLELFRDLPEEQRQTRYAQDSDLLHRQLVAGDFFLCATERQRDLYVGALMAHGRVTPTYVDTDPHLRGLIDVVPYGLPTEPPVKQGPALRDIIAGIGADDPLILWSGGLWDWMDPLTLIEAMPLVIAQVPEVRLAFLAGPHPSNTHPMQMPGACRKRAEALGLHDRHIFFYEQWVPYHQRADFLLEATIAVSLHRDHLETDYAAVRSRILDHLWAGLPSIVSAGGAAAELLTDAGAGLVVPPGDHEAVARALLLLLHDPEQRTAQSLAARERARTLTWEQVAGPLVRFCRAPRRTRPDADTLAIQTARPQPAPPPALAPTAGEVPEPASESLATLEACRNAALAVQEQTWQVQEQPVVRGRFNRLRQFLINQIVRPFLAPLIEQQQTYNAAVLRSMYAMNEATDQRYSTLIHWMNRRIGDIQQEMNDRFRDALEHIQGVRQHLRGVEQFSRQVEQYAQGVYRNSQDVHRYAQGIEQYVQRLEQYARTLEQRLQENEQSFRQSFHQSQIRAGEDTRRVEDYTRRVEDYTRRVEHQAQDLNQRSLELAMRVEKLKVNDLLFRQQFTDIAEQLAGLEDTDSQLVALWRGENAPLPVKEMTFDTREPPVSPGQTVAEAPPPDEPAATAREASLQERTRLAQQATPPPDEPSAAPAETEKGEGQGHGKEPPDQPAPAPKKRTTTGKRTSTRSRTRKPPGSKSTDQ